MIYSIAHAHEVQLQLYRFSNPATSELCTNQGERRQHQDLAWTALRDYTPGHDAELLTQQHVLLPRCVSLVSVYMLNAHCFRTGKICGPGQCECDTKSH